MSGESSVPSSLRPDGTIRKQIKIRPGYTPPELAPRYVNPIARDRMQRFERFSPGVPLGYEPALANKEKLVQKNALAISQEKGKESDGQRQQTAQLRGLRKKLRQIELLEEKKEKGVSLNKDENKKLSSKVDLEKEMHSLALSLSSLGVLD